MSALHKMIHVIVSAVDHVLLGNNIGGIERIVGFWILIYNRSHRLKNEYITLYIFCEQLTDRLVFFILNFATQKREERIFWYMNLPRYQVLDIQMVVQPRCT